MAQASHIEWTDSTWNPVTGCSKVSPGCKNCYAERMAHRLQSMGQSRYRNGFVTTLQEDVVDTPLRWRKPRLVFVNSMSDLFHDQVPFRFIERVFETMDAAHWHVFQILTKRSERLREVAADLPWPSNVWMGVSVETPAYYSRIIDLAPVPAAVRFLSLEPLLAALPDLPLSDVEWVIAGGESGPRARPMAEEWVTEIRDQCVAGEVPFFFKQWGGVRKSTTGRALQGEFWDQMPTPRSIGQAAAESFCTAR